MLHSRFVCAGETLTAHMAFTDRLGGYSTGVFSSLNLARHVGDDDSVVTANRALLAGVLGLRGLAFTEQVHGTTIRVLDEAPRADDPPVEADAQITSLTGIGLVTMVADCVPLLLAAPDTGLVACVHAGRRGMAAGIAARTVAEMRRRGAEEIAAAVGPSISPRRYEVPLELRDEVAAAEPIAASVSAQGTPALDVASGVVEQLRREGVSLLSLSESCTAAEPSLYSYRRDGRTGRFAGVVWLENSATRP